MILVTFYSIWPQIDDVLYRHFSVWCFGHARNNVGRAKLISTEIDERSANKRSQTTRVHQQQIRTINLYCSK